MLIMMDRHLFHFQDHHIRLAAAEAGDTDTQSDEVMTRDTCVDPGELPPEQEHRDNQSERPAARQSRPVPRGNDSFTPGNNTQGD